MASFEGCRKESDYITDPQNYNANRYTTFTEQFEAIWNGINSSYVFWKVDTVDWDARYARMKPKFEALDKQPSVTNTELLTIYRELCEGLIDHHMRLMVWNLNKASDADPDNIVFKPCQKEIGERSYYHTSTTFDQYYSALTQLSAHGHSISNLERVTHNNFDIICGIIDGKYAYLHMNKYYISGLETATDINSQNQFQLIQKYMSWCQDPSIKGIILDNRGNSGGYVHDLRYIIAPLVSHDKVIAHSYTKDGLGRLEYSVPIPCTIHATGNGRDDIPKVVLTDLWSISMGEMTTYCMKDMPKGIQIGERTYGATGPLNDDFYMNHCGIFGDKNNGPHYVYTSCHMMEFEHGGVLEGIGMTPDIEVLNDGDQIIAGNDVILNRALDYLNSNK